MSKFIIEIKDAKIRLYENGSFICYMTKEEMATLGLLCRNKLEEYEELVENSIHGGRE